MKQNLLPCPWCGSLPNKMINTAVDCGYVVACRTSECTIENDYFQLDKWNRRAHSSDYIAGLEKALHIVVSQPFYPDTHTGMRQQWVKDQIAEKIRAEIERAKK